MQTYINDTLQYLTYLTQKQDAEEKEDKFQESLRNARKGKRS